MKKVLALSLFMLVFSACGKLLTDDDTYTLREYEKGIYSLKIDLQDNNGNTLKKGSRVKIISKSTNDFVKFYAYSYDLPFKDSSRFLLLYLFSEDFPKSEAAKEETNKNKKAEKAFNYDPLAEARKLERGNVKEEDTDLANAQYSKEKFESYLNEVVQKIGEDKVKEIDTKLK